jgi:hypothetical protein
MDRIKEQATKFWQIVSAAETAKTYQQAAGLTWQIIKELGLLLWLVLCLVLVAGDWFWKNSILAGRRFRQWINNLEQPSPDRMVSQAGQALLSASKGSVNVTLSKARSELGLPEPAPLPPVTPAPAKPNAKDTAPSPAPASVSPPTSPTTVDDVPTTVSKTPSSPPAATEASAKPPANSPKSTATPPTDIAEVEAEEDDSDDES